MSFDMKYADSSPHFKGVSDHPILTAADLARCEAISPRRKTPVAEIVRAVSVATGIPATEIYGPGRTDEVAQARHIVMLKCREKGMTLQRIGELLGGRCHTTVLAGIKAEKERRGEL